jgi:trehalose 6-phosphate phosphatase
MTQPLANFDLSGLTPDRIALLVDFDGTLVEFADHPDDVALSPETKSIIEAMLQATNGALAIVTGRAISDIDRFFAPLLLPVAGVHGMTRRTAWGELHTASVDNLVLATLKAKLEGFVGEHPGLLLEVKPGSLALHYRLRPELEEEAVKAVHDAVAGLDGLQILHGKMVIEAKAGKATKAEAVAAFMREEPFKGRLPIFAGDDVTDEYAFGEIARHGGISIKIGEGQTSALYRTEGILSFRAWLRRLQGMSRQDGSNNGVA